jgi:hypothetical protein
MEQQALREVWAELCFHLSDNINPNINENVFEQKVLFTLEKLFGWSQFKGEIKVKPSLPIGRQSFITPDIVVYTPDNKAVVVLEIKRPAEDLSRLGSFGQLQSYMRQTKAEFGLLIGKEIHVYYDGVLNPHPDPLLLSKIRFKSDSAEGTDFVDLFNRNSFIAGKYESYLKAHIDRLERERRIDALREHLQSEETSQKMLKLLQAEFRDVEAQVLMEAMKGLTIKISYQQGYENKKNGPPDTPMQETVFVCKNKTSGKYFIYIDDLRDNELRLINPDGKSIDLSADLFDQPKHESIKYLLSYKLITETQLKKYNEYESQQTEIGGTSIKGDPRRIMSKKKQSTGRTTGQKSPSPSPYEWSRGVPELSRISGRVTWRAICDYLKVDVGVDSARRVLKDWARENRRGWPEIPEP